MRGGGPEWRQLSFRASGLTIELEITGSGDYRRLIGQLIPRQSAVVDVRHGQGVITVEADSLGRFSAEEVPFGQISLRCLLGSDQAPIITGWISLFRTMRQKARGAVPQLLPEPRPLASSTERVVAPNCEIRALQPKRSAPPAAGDSKSGC